MKIFCENFNGVLDDVVIKLSESGQLTDNYHEADAFLLWQDVRGTCLELARIVKEQLKKPIIVMQHGRGSTRDYCPPNRFELLADRILVWGDFERDRLIRNGTPAERIEVVGCPLFGRLKRRKAGREGKNVLFVPVISQKEEPENILVYSALKKWECDKLTETIYKHFDKLKEAWAWQEQDFKEIELPDGTKERRLWRTNVHPNLPRWVTYGAGLLNVKLSGIHDQHQYLSPLVVNGQNDPNLIPVLAELLANTDAMVCLEEGTMQLLAAALDIPVIVADIFRYKDYGGCKDYDKVEKIRTNACYWTNNLDKIGHLLNHALANPAELRKHRQAVCELEGGAHLGDITGNIIRAIEAIVKIPVTA